MRRFKIKFIKMKIPYGFMVFTWLPVFLLACIVPSTADSQFYQLVEKMIDEHLFGKVGVWSSAFPLTSKAVANYICLVAPVCAVIFTIVTMRKSIVESSDVVEWSVGKQIFILISFLGLVAFVFYFVFIGGRDFASLGNRYSFFGNYKITFALFSVGILYLLYVMTLFGYLAFKMLFIVVFRCAQVNIFRNR